MTYLPVPCRELCCGPVQGVTFCSQTKNSHRALLWVGMKASYLATEILFLVIKVLDDLFMPCFLFLVVVVVVVVVVGGGGAVVVV